MAIHLVQYNPEIPQNTGNIMRTCAATDIKLHLIKPMGFSLDEKSIKRSGANYVNEVDYTVYENWEEFVEKNKGGKLMVTMQGCDMFLPKVSKRVWHFLQIERLSVLVLVTR